ncbi:hypothetical protein FACS1894202_02170 [Clostridia bacterium]|nr:hypothetical protein FACS1894202_02170 [Clostridia bacterium]
MKEINPILHENVRVLGRTLGTAPLNLFWTGSGVEFDLRGSELWATLEADYDDLEPWIALLLNGQPVVRQPLERGTHRRLLLRGLDPERPHHIQLLRESQAGSGSIKLHNLEIEGEIAPLSPSKYRVEFIGDSLTSAEGSLGCPLDSEWRPIWFTACKNWARLTAERLCAEHRIISQSGWGVGASWNGDLNCALPDYYEYVCGMAEGGKIPNDFNAWKPDLVVCALGTNDNGALNNAPEKVNTQFLEKKTRAFVEKLRKLNPDSKVVWVFFENTQPMDGIIEQVIGSSFISLPEMTHEIWNSGARNHPGAAWHESIAEYLAPRLEALL